MIIILLLAATTAFSARTDSMKSVTLKANEEVTREGLRAARICDGKERKCADGQRAGLVLPSCELICPEDNRQDLSCYRRHFPPLPSASQPIIDLKGCATPDDRLVRQCTYS